MTTKFHNKLRFWQSVRVQLQAAAEFFVEGTIDLTSDVAANSFAYPALAVLVLGNVLSLVSAFVTVPCQVVGQLSRPTVSSLEIKKEYISPMCTF
jgi:hypothetical protein